MTATAMPARFNGYPPSLRAAINSIYLDPLRCFREICRKSEKVNYSGKQVDLQATDSKLKDCHFLSAICGPCLVLAKVVKSDDKLEEASFAHFSAKFKERDIDDFLGLDKTKANRTMLWMAGMAQRTSIKTLWVSVDLLYKRIQNFGIPLRIEGQGTERPIIKDTRGREMTISDIGLGVGDNGHTRRVIFGIDRSHSVFISITGPEYLSTHLHTYIFPGDGNVEILS